MIENKDPRELPYFNIIMDGESLKVEVSELYGSYFTYSWSPTGNCQMSSAVNFCNVMHFLDKYKIRDLFIKIRKSRYCTKKILLLDLNQKHAIKVVEWLAPACIIGNMPYLSTNGSKMNIILLKISSIRQLQMPKVK